MKKFKVCFIIFALLLCIFALNSCNSDLSPDFKESYPELGNDFVNRNIVINRHYNDILTVSDGWIAVGRLYGAPLDAVIAKYDNNGEVVWENAFGGSDLDEFYSVAEISDGYIVIAGCHSVDGDLLGLDETNRGSSHTITVKYDRDGNKVWAKELPANTIVANEGGFLAAYHYNGIYIIQFDVEGNIIWSKSIGNSLTLYNGTNNLNVVKILKGQEGYFLFGKTRNVGSFGDFSEGPGFIAAMNADGNVIWQKKVSMYEIEDVTISTDGIIIVGVSYNEEPPYRLPCVKKFDFEMNIIWETSYEKNYYLNFTKAAEIGGNIFVAGFTQDKNDRSFVFGINASGEIFWENVCKENKDSVIYYNVFSVDEKIVVYRHAYNYGASSIVENTFLFYDLASI